MPTYSYRCADCGHAFDIHQAFTDDTLTVCPNCGGDLRKVFSAVGVTFSGSGFYRTDSRAPSSDGGSAGGSSSGSTDAGGSSASSAKSDSGSSSSSSGSSTGYSPASGGSAPKASAPKKE